MNTFSPRIQDLVDTVRHNPYERVAVQHLLDINTQESNQALRYLLETIPSFPLFKWVLDELAKRNFVDPLEVMRGILATPWNQSHFPSRHATVVQHLSDYCDDPRAYDLLLDVLNSSKRQTCTRIRAQAAYALHHFDDDRTLYVLAKTLRYHPEDTVQMQAADAISRLKSPYVMDVLLHYLDDQSPQDLIRHTGRYKGQLTTVNWAVLGAISKLWKSGIRPIQCKNLLFILEKCLYAEDRVLPTALSLLKHMDTDKTKCIVNNWRRRQQECGKDEFQLFV